MIITKDKVKYGKQGEKFDLIPSAITNDKRLAFIEFKLMVIFCNSSEKKYTPSINSLAKQLDVDAKTIDKALKNLKAFGYIHTSGSSRCTTLHVHQIPIEQALIDKYTKVIDPKKRG